MKSIDRKQIPNMMILEHLGHMIHYHGMKQMEKYDLKPGQAGILFILDHQGELSQRELAKAMCIKPPSMTVSLQKMQKKGYVIRTTDQTDQRITRISLTEKGKDCVGAIKEALLSLNEQMLEGVSKEQQKMLRDMLFQMQDNMEKISQSTERTGQ